MGLTTKVPRELLENIMTGTLEKDMSNMLFDQSTTISTPTTSEYRNDEEVEVLNTEQKLDNLIKTTRNILEIKSDTDENTEDLIFDNLALTQRNIAAQNLKSQANRMVTRGKGILLPLKVGNNVLVSIPSVDRGRGDAANLLSVIIEENDGKFHIVTKEILST
ncbi:hypothetical protein QTP88_002448 [Uroleucon formosanum]